MSEVWRCVDCNLIHEPYGESPEGFICKCYGAIEKVTNTSGNQLIKKSMEETNEQLADKIKSLTAERNIIDDQINQLKHQILLNCPVDLEQPVVITDHRGQERSATITRIWATASGKYSIKFNKTKKDGTPSKINDYIYSDVTSIVRSSDGFDVKSIMS